jgi:hypothetical protein
MGAAVSPRITVNGAASGAAAVEALCNQLRAALITFGWLQ